MKNNSNITFVYFIVDSFEETVFWENKAKNRNQNILVVTPETYEPKSIMAFPHLKINNLFSTNGIKSIFNYINTDWVMLMRPEEVFTNIINTNRLKSGAYSVLVKKTLSKSGREFLIYEDIKLFHRNYQPNKEVLFFNTIVFNYTGHIPEIENRNLRTAINSYNSGNKDLKLILYLLDKNLLNIDLDTLLNEYYDENDKSPENLDLLRYVARRYIIYKDFDKAKDILFKALMKFPNSPCINSLLSELHFILGDYTQAELFILNCIKMGNEMTFYKQLPFNTAIITYAAHYFLAKIYYKMENYEKAKIAFEDCLDEKPDFKLAVDEYNLLLKEMPTVGVNELNFACQGCGNCCRHFKTVNVNHQDVLKIMEHKPELKFEDIVDYYYDEKLKTHLLNLKKQKDSIDCMFLQDNKCVVNEFKPLGCKIWPFTIKGDDIITWTNSNRAFIKDYCSYKEIEGANNKEELMKNIKKHKQNSDDLIRLLKRWEDNISGIDNKLNPNLIEEMKKEYFMKKSL
ncbi:MAG: YkgJ family cysteine cluster protein [Candidatus Sericytochromatia bacterium]